MTILLYLQPHIPPYASNIHFELYRNVANEHYIQIFYRNTEVEKSFTIEFTRMRHEVFIGSNVRNLQRDYSW